MTDLTEYLNSAIERLVKHALKSSLQNPLESAVILKYMQKQNKTAKNRKIMETEGLHIPPFLIASIASQCNLFCKGCYARSNHACSEHLRNDDLKVDEWDRIFQEASKLGVSFILLAGGEPLLRRDVIEAAASYPEIIFPIFTNGTVLDDNYINLFNKNRNLVPVLSIEGNEVQTDARRGKGVYSMLQANMNKLSEKGIFFGASITVTTQNIETVTGCDFISSLYQKGCKLAVFVEYVPVDPDSVHLAFSDNERASLESALQNVRIQFEDMLFLSFPGDEKFVGGCLAAGRGFFHINSHGGAEPCPFSPYSDTSLKNSSLVDALRSPLFYKLNSTGLLKEDHKGGCALFGREKDVSVLLE